MVSVAPETPLAVPGAPEHRHLVRTGVLVALASAAVSTAFLSPLLRKDLTTFTADLAVAVSLSTAGVLLAHDPAQRRTGRALVVVAALWLVSWANEWGVGPLPLVSQVVGPLWYVLGAYALFRYPHTRLQHPCEPVFLVVLALWACGGSLVRAMLSRPEWHDFPPDVSWPPTWPDLAVFEAATTIWFVGLGVLLLVLPGLLLAKLRRSRGLGRAETIPTAVAAGSVAGAGIVYVGVHLVEVPQRTTALSIVVIAAAVVATPIAFLVTVLRRHAARAAVADLVVSLADSPSVDSIRSALRTALRDPSLELYFWRDDEARYADEDDAVPQHTEDRWRVEIADRDDRPLALLIADPALRRHPELVQAAVGAGGLALSNGRLHQQVRAQLEEVRASRHRIVAATQEERRRIERDLHDGAQQSLLSISATLATAQLHVQDRPDAAAVIARAQDHLRRAVHDLRDLARGLHPAVLTDGGLVPALERVAEGLALPTTIHAPADRPPAEVEAAAYFVATEALTNVVRHAHATRAEVTVTHEDGRLRLEVGDDGRGGAEPAAGSGLAGLRDRVQALGGDLTVADRPGGGTLLVADLPCA